MLATSIAMHSSSFGRVCGYVACDRWPEPALGEHRRDELAVRVLVHQLQRGAADNVLTVPR